MKKTKETLIKEQNLLLKKSLQQEQRKGKPIEGHVGLMPSVMTGAMGADSFEGSLLAPAGQAEEDKKAFLRLRELSGNPNRKMWVDLSVYEMRVVAALSYLLSINGQIEAEDVQDIIMHPDKDKYITRTFQLGDLAKVIHDKRKDDFKLKIFDSLRELHSHFDVYRFNNKVRILPLIRVSFDVDLNDGRESVTVDFGLPFFLGVKSRFAYLTPQLFLAWGRNGRQNELYARLQFYLLNILTVRKESYFAQAEKLRKEARYSKLTGDERKQFQQQKEEEIEQLKASLMYHDVNVETIKRKVSTDYDDRRIKAKFKQHFEAAVEGYKEAGILLDGELIKGKRGQQKAIFKLNLDYGTNLLSS